ALVPLNRTIWDPRHSCKECSDSVKSHAMSEVSAATQDRYRPGNEALALGVLAAGLIVFAIAAPSAYSLYLMLHIFFATVWVGGGATIALLAFMLDRARDPVQLGRFGPMTEELGLRVFLPSWLI